MLVADPEKLVEDRVMLLLSLDEDGNKDENELVITMILVGNGVGVDDVVVEFK